MFQPILPHLHAQERLLKNKKRKIEDELTEDHRLCERSALCAYTKPNKEKTNEKKNYRIIQ